MRPLVLSDTAVIFFLLLFLHFSLRQTGGGVEMGGTQVSRRALAHFTRASIITLHTRRQQHYTHQLTNFSSTFPLRK
jgi:hypothetical protein